MAIISPTDLPTVLRVASDPMKAYVLAKMGYPSCEVEITEQQFEIVLRVTGDFISGFFPREQRLKVFYTTPLQSTYPMPEDAYWIQQVNWDPVSRLNDIFSAESYLFCHPGGTKLLTTKGFKECEKIYDDPTVRLITPFGPRKPRMRWNEIEQPVQILKTEHDAVICTPNHPVNLDGKFRMAIVGFPGLHLLDSNDKQIEIVDRGRTKTPGTWSVETSSGCYYVSATGKNAFLVH